MEIVKAVNGSALTLSLVGRLDTNTSPQLENELNGCLDGVTALTFDFEKLEYISSAGLRVLLSTHKTMSKQGSMEIVHVNEDIMEVFDITGFADFLTIH